MRLEGVVRRVELYGAFVDIGLERDGLVHISQLSDRRVDRVADVVKEGDRVTVWVTQVDPDHGRVALTMVPPPERDWKEIAEGQTYVGRVVRVERYGLFVDIGAERPGLLHAREMGTCTRPTMFRVGDEIEVRILALDRRKKRIDLAMGDSADSLNQEGEEDDLPSLIELAFRKAQEQASHRPRPAAARQRESRRNRAQEEILSRTLRQHSR